VAVFLDSYLFLRKLPELLQPKELLSTMKNNQAQTEGTIVLQSLDIENDKIRCTDDCALQALIAYVKTLLQLIPRVKENVKRASSSNEILNFFYHDKTRRYLEQINEIPLYFETDILCFGNFLNSEVQSIA